MQLITTAETVQKIILGLVFLAGMGLAVPARSQATTRACGVAEEAGPACLLGRKELASLPRGQVYWHLDQYKTHQDAEKAAVTTSVVVEAFGSTWLFTIEQAEWRAKGGQHAARIGPLPVEQASTYAVEYLRSIFTPGTTAPLHTHSGPEAFYAVSGDTCLETPDGVQTGRGPGNSLMIKAGPPMLLMAIGKVPRQGFALILHDASQAPTTLTHDWHPEGLCARQLATDQAGQ